MIATFVLTAVGELKVLRKIRLLFYLRFYARVA
jgi:hypothetical protein